MQMTFGCCRTRRGAVRAPPALGCGRPRPPQAGRRWKYATAWHRPPLDIPLRHRLQPFEAPLRRPSCPVQHQCIAQALANPARETPRCSDPFAPASGL